MLKKVKSYLSDHPRMRVLAIVVGVITVFSIAMHVFNRKSNQKKYHTPPSSIITQKVPLSTKVDKSLSHQDRIKKMSKNLDDQNYRKKVTGGETILHDGWFKRHSNSIVRHHGKNNSEAENIKVNKTKVDSKVSVDSSKSKAQVVSNKNPASSIMSPSEFIKQKKKSSASNSNSTSSISAHKTQNQTSFERNRSYNQSRSSQVLSNMQRPLTQQERHDQMIKEQKISNLASSMQSELDSTLDNNSSTPTVPSFDNIDQKEDEPIVNKQEIAQKKAAELIANPGQIIKAGTIFYGVTTNKVDSDQASTPVLANIETGPFRGAKLIGRFSREGEKLVIRFNTMVTKDRAKSFSIGEVYAIDTRDGQMAVQTGIDHHYLLRYGSLLAGSFLSGIGQAVTPPQNHICLSPQLIPGTSSGSESFRCLDGSTISGSESVSRRLRPGQVILLRGLGEIGTTIGDNVKQSFNTPPTVTVDKGTMIGLLFMKDVTLPKKPSVALDSDYQTEPSQLDFLDNND